MDTYSQIDAPDYDYRLPLQRANLFYSIQILVFSIICLIFLFVPNSWLLEISRIEASSRIGIGFSFTVRISFALFLWYITHCLFTIGNRDLYNSFQFKFHSLFLSFHEIFLNGLIFGCLFIPEKFVPIFFKISIFISAIYLIFQFFTLYNMFDKINTKFYSEKRIVLPIIILILLIGFSISFFVISFIYFNCRESRLAAGLNLILCIIIIVFSIILEDQSVITASMVSAYVSYITVMGLMVDYECCSFPHKAISIIFIISSAIFTLSFLIWNSFNLTWQMDLLTCSEQDESRFSLSYFHFVFAFASCFITMLVTNWGDPNGTHFFNKGTTIWIKWTNIAISWIIISLYIWSFFAKKCCPYRDFD